jgi:hypothetical protein
MSTVDTNELIKLVVVAQETIAMGSQVRGLLDAVHGKLILLSAAQSAAKAGASQELLAQILDERN